MDEVIITAAITGSITSREQSPNHPITWDEITDAAVSSWRAGASVIHLHARDQDGTPTQDKEVYRLLVDKIVSTGCDAILNLSTGAAGGRANLDEREKCLELDPEMATIDCGSMNYGDERVMQGPYVFLRRLASLMRSRHIVPEIEVFDTGMIHSALRLIDEQLLQPPGVWQLCLGIQGGATPDLLTINCMLSFLPKDAVWFLLGVGRHQIRVNLIALANGGHVRTGLEDNVYFRRGELAKSNAELVERIVRLADDIGRPVASPARAREILGVRGAVVA
ncbi:MAG: beta-keto acid cleavage family enzyme [Candidatus Dormibacteraceae bacterium]